jgi:hypothetical protein
VKASSSRPKSPNLWLTRLPKRWSSLHNPPEPTVPGPAARPRDRCVCWGLHLVDDGPQVPRRLDLPELGSPALAPNPGRPSPAATPRPDRSTRLHNAEKQLPTQSSWAPNCSINLDCGEGEYCKKSGCNDVIGFCRQIPFSCLTVWDPVCGCDGETYSNACFAAHFGVNIASTGECPP